VVFMGLLSLAVLRSLIMVPMAMGIAAAILAKRSFSLGRISCGGYIRGCSSSVAYVLSKRAVWLLMASDSFVCGGAGIVGRCCLNQKRRRWIWSSDQRAVDRESGGREMLPGSQACRDQPVINAPAAAGDLRCLLSYDRRPPLINA